MPADNSTRPGSGKATDEYGRIFPLLLGVFFFAMVTTDTRWTRILVAVAVIAVFLGTLRATGVTERRMRHAIFISVALGVASLGADFSDARPVRAAETGRPVVHAAVSGVSAVFAGNGRRLAWLGSDAVGTWQANPRLTTGTTFYVRIGDWVPIICILLLVGGMVAAGMRTARRSSFRFRASP